MPFYAVRNGRKPGVYPTWDECQTQIKSYSGAKYKKFSNEADAREFVGSLGQVPEIVKLTPSVPVIRPAPKNVYTPALVPKPQNKSLDNDHEPYTIIYNELKEVNLTPCDMFSSRLLDLRGTLGRLSSMVNSTQVLIKQAEEQLQNLEKANSRKRKCYSPEPMLTETRLNVPHNSINSNEEASKHVKLNVDSNNSSEDTAYVWTDGSCHNNGRSDVAKRGGIGVFWGENDPRNISEPLTGRFTNNRAEIIAAHKAVVQAKDLDFRNLVIHTDSSFLINCMTKWITKWKKNGWKVSGGEPVINKEELVHLESVMDGINVEWVHVRGHQGNVGNEAADKLANDGAYQSSDLDFSAL